MQAVPARFAQLSQGDIRPHSWGSLISFTKAFDDDITFFTLNVSQLNGSDILGTSTDNPLQNWDKYEYDDYSERIIDMAVTRELTFPYSTASAVADFTLNNYDKYFTPNSGSPINDYIRPKRPVRLLQGLETTKLPQFVGLTQGMPEIGETDATARFTALDFLTQIYDMDIRNTNAMRDVRTDEVLKNIFTQFGLSPAQYDLAKGRNIIKYLFFEKDQLKAGDVIRPIMQAEGGALWLDENGIIRFRPRLEQSVSAVYSFDEDSIVSAAVIDEDQIINRMVINTDVREVQEWQTVYSKKTTDTSLNVVPASGTALFKADLQDPVLDIVQPIAGENAGVSWFTASLPDGSPVTNVSVVSVELKTNTYEIVFSNTNPFSVNINQLNLWAQPAKKISVEPIVYENKDQDSIDKYEEKTLEISNNFIQDIEAAKSLSYTTLDDYSEYADLIEVEVKGTAALQLSDIVDIDYVNFSGEYRVIKVYNKLQGSKFTQILKLRKYTYRNWFTLNQSQLNGTDQIAP